MISPILIPPLLPCGALVPDHIWGILTVAQEARSESYLGQVAVAEVIRNRMRKKYFSDGTVPGTVLRPKQFSGWNTGDANRILCASLTNEDPKIISIHRAWKEAFEDNSNHTLGSLLYHADYLDPFPVWTSNSRVIRTVTIGRHIFYRVSE